MNTASQPQPATLEEFGHASKIPAVVLGATGTVGQRFVSLLTEHPWFEVVAVAASERSAGRAYREATRWVQTRSMHEQIAEMTLLASESKAIEAATAERCVVFSALDASVALEIERDFSRAGHLVVSNARSHRMHENVPLLVPEVNAEHLDLAHTQAEVAELEPGRILTNPNCSTIGLVMALAPLVSAFGVDRLYVVTLQAISGAGLPGVPSFEIVDNVIPLIGGEEEKMERETLKILGRWNGETKSIDERTITVSAQANRVPVIDGHTLCVSVGLINSASHDDIVAAWRDFESEPQTLRLPSAPQPPIHYLGDDTPPQPRLHRDLGAGMAISTGRLRPCPLLDWRFVALSHNTVRGAAGGAILVAELAVARGLFAAGS